MASTSNQPSRNHPRGDLLDQGRRTDYINICVPLFQASVIGDWEAVENILNIKPELKDVLLGYSITQDKETTLMIATFCSQSIKFVEHLVNRMTVQQLTLQDKYGRTALNCAAMVGNVDMARAMLGKCSQLLTIRANYTHELPLPIHIAALNGKHNMVAYLYDEYKSMAGGNYMTDNDIHLVFSTCIAADLFDSAQRLLDDQNNIGFPRQPYAADVLYNLAQKTSAFKHIKTSWKNSNSALRILDDQNDQGNQPGFGTFPHPSYARDVLYNLAQKTSAFKHIKSWKNSITWVRPAKRENSVATELLRKIWKNILERPIDEIDDILKGPMVITKDKEEKYPFKIPFVAAEIGNTKFLVELIRGYPDLLWRTNDNRQNIFHIAVLHRQESIYNLLYEMGSANNVITRYTDKDGNNMLHLVGMKAKSPLKDVSGAAFLMQRELLWFKEVNSKVPYYSREEKNIDGRTPLQLFIENHHDMVSEGKKWMKETANQCMVVAALITTVVFSVAFTIPGGYDQNTGRPIFRKDGPFIAFVILDAISLILSSASILMFLSILTSRYAQDDFLVALPKKLMIGLTTLFLSIITMMVAFAVSFFVLYHNKLISIPIIISVGAVVPIFLYMKLQFPLLVDVYRSTYGRTYGSRYIFRPKKRVLYYRNPRF